MCTCRKMNSLKSSLTFAIIVFVNPPCQHTQQRNYGECAEDGTNNAATAVAIHCFFPAFSRYLKKFFFFLSLANLIRFHSFNHFNLIVPWAKMTKERKTLRSRHILRDKQEDISVEIFEGSKTVRNKFLMNFPARLKTDH